MLYRWEHAGAVLYRSPLLDALEIPHGFGTRHGDEQTIIRSLALTERQWVRVRQVHGRAVHLASKALSEKDGSLACDADAVVLSNPSQATRILTADCVPILLASADGTKVAAVHAGWRGLVSGVVEEAVNALAADFVAAIGPCISAKHFEVGQEVAGHFDPRFIRQAPGSRPHIDLRAATEALLHHLGAKEIDSTDRCTYEQEGDFFSHRRDVTHHQQASTGRMSSVIACRARD